MTISLAGLSSPPPSLATAVSTFAPPNVHSSLQSVVSSGLLPSATLSSPPLYHTTTSGNSSSIAHIPLSLARRHLSSVSSEAVNHRQRQSALVNQLTGAFVLWQQQAVDEYSQILQRCKRDANNRIATLSKQPSTQTADLTAGKRHPTDESGEWQPQRNQPTDALIASSPSGSAAAQKSAAPTVSQPLDTSVQSGSTDTAGHPSDATLAATQAEWKTATEHQQEAVRSVQQMAKKMGLHTLPADCHAPLHSLHSSLGPWTAARSTLAARVQTIKQTQAALQTEKARLTAWKERIKQQQQASSSEAGGSADRLAEESKQWEAAKHKLAADGAHLKDEHAEYEKRIAEYKVEETSLKQRWTDIARTANGNAHTSEPTPLPTADKLGSLIGALQQLQQADQRAADANAQVAAVTAATQQQQQKQQTRQEPPVVAKPVTAAPVGASARENTGSEQQQADTLAALSAAERRIEEQRRELADLTRQLATAQQVKTANVVHTAPQTAIEPTAAVTTTSTTQRAGEDGGTAAETVQLSSAPCSSCDSLLVRCSALQTSLSELATDLSTATALLSSERDRHAAVEAEWRQQQSAYLASAAGSSVAAEAEVARQVRLSSERQVQLEDLSRLLDETVRKGNRELNESRANQQRLMEEAVSTLERQQANERQQWAQQLEAAVVAASGQSKAREAVEVRLAEEERKWRETDAQLTEQREAYETLRAEAAEALQTRDGLLARIAAATADIERLHALVEAERKRATQAEVERTAMFEKMLEEQKRRKEFQFKYEDAKGKVRVYARVRPFTAAEVAARERTLLRPGRNDWTLELNETQRDVLGHITDKWRDFAFDHVFHAGLLPDSAGNGSQVQVFEETAAFAELSLQGINCCIFAYGQSGTGQTGTGQTAHQPDLLVAASSAHRLDTVLLGCVSTHSVCCSQARRGLWLASLPAPRMGRVATCWA